MKLVAVLWPAEAGLRVVKEGSGEAADDLTDLGGSGVRSSRVSTSACRSIRGEESRNCCRDSNVSSRLLLVDLDGTRFNEIGGGRVPVADGVLTAAAAAGTGGGCTVCAA